MEAHTDTITYLNSLINYEKSGFGPDCKHFDLDKLRVVLEKSGNPHHDYRCVHVAGTKGKGSICEFASGILQASGYRVGLFTSPHLSSPNERIKINGNMIRDDDIAGVVSCLREHLGHAEGEFTFFEVYTLLALLYFSKEKVDHAIFEVGLGGRLDATNVIFPDVCAISPVSYDHMEVLGSKIDEIAIEKAAIIKKGTHCVSAEQIPSVLNVIDKRCREVGASLSVVGKDITYKPTSLSEVGSCFDVISRDTARRAPAIKRYEGCKANMPGEFQVSNAATAVGICEKLLGAEKTDMEAFKRGIQNAFLPGRLETLCRCPAIVIDGAQNGASAEHLKYSVEQIFKYDKLILLLGISDDKYVKSVCRELVPIADEIILTR